MLGYAANGGLIIDRVKKEELLWLKVPFNLGVMGVGRNYINVTDMATYGLNPPKGQFSKKIYIKHHYLEIFFPIQGKSKKKNPMFFILSFQTLKFIINNNQQMHAIC